MELRYYQKDILNQINENPSQRICVQLATGGGKTVIFSKLAEEFDGRVLVLVDSKELVQQTAKHIKGAATFEAKNKIIPKERVIISMVQTLKSRMKKENLISDFDLIIIDECHILQYESLLEVVNCKVIGFTATPITMRKDYYLFCFEHKIMTKNGECCDNKKIEFSKDFALGDIWDDIIVGIPIKNLIEENYLVKDNNFVIPIDESQIILDQFGEVSNTEEVFDEKYQMDVLNNYKEYCLGKKTMIFTQNTTLNKVIYDQFINDGFDNVFMYDSVNDSEFKRHEIVDKFEQIPNAILFNVGVFTKGFDVTDVECIIVARRISSLALWIQIVGRGSRTTEKIFKDSFTVIDGGNNIERFGRWSSEFDWKKLFHGNDDYKPKKEQPEELLKECDNCGNLIKETQCICDLCEHNHCKIKEVKYIDALAVSIDIIKPDVSKIIEYAARNNKDKFFAFKVLNQQIYKMFQNVPREQYLRNGKGVERVMNEYLKPGFFKIINADLPSKANRTFRKQKELLTEKLNKKYGKSI